MKKKLTPAVINKFLDALVQTRHVEESAKLVGLSRETLYRHRRKNPAFKLAWEQAIEHRDIWLRDEAMRRVRQGFKQPVYYKGKRIETLRRHNDQLLVQLLRIEVARQERLERRAAEAAGEKKDELDEILELIDGKTRRIHDE